MMDIKISMDSSIDVHVNLGNAPITPPTPSASAAPLAPDYTGAEGTAAVLEMEES